MTDERLHRARIVLEGLAVGDAFGSFFEFNPGSAHLITERRLPPTPWKYTDDTNMALSVYHALQQTGYIDQDALAASLTAHFDAERNYSMGVRTLLLKLADGEQWQQIAPEMFWGEGSFGNDAAPRVAPLGAYLADDLDSLVTQTIAATQITHTHPEGIAGAIAVAVAVACAWQMRSQPASCQALIARILPHIPEGEVHDGLRRARDLSPDTDTNAAATVLGNGSRVSAQDTIPFAVWCAGQYLDNYEEATWQTASAQGDVDTLCAIVGAVVTAYSGLEAIPLEWQRHRERLAEWAFNTSV